MKHSKLFPLLLLSSILLANCTQKTERAMEKNKQKTFTVVEDDIAPPPSIITSKFKNIIDWLTQICKEETTNKSISQFKVGLFEASHENILYLVGTNSTEKGDTTYHTMDFEPKEMYFLLPASGYKDLSRKKLLEKLNNQLKDFTRTETFKTSFLAKAKSIIFEPTGQDIWQSSK